MKKIIAIVGGCLYLVFLMTLIGIKPMVYEVLKSEADGVYYVTTKDYSITGEYDSIEVQNGIWDVIFEPGDTDETVVHTCGPEGIDIKAEILENTLTVREESTLSDIAYNHVIIKDNATRPSATIYIPKKAYEKIECEMTYGWVKINSYGSSDDSLSFKTLAARSESGGLEVGVPVSESVDVSTVSGQLSLVDKFGDITFESVIGNFYLDGNAYGDVKAYTDGGKDDIKAYVTGSIDVKTVVGDVALLLRGECRDIRVQTNNAGIDISNARADTITAKSAAGDVNIRGSIGWSFIDVLTSSGSIDLDLIATKKLKSVTLAGNTKVRTAVEMQYDIEGMDGEIEHPASSGECECYLRSGMGEATVSYNPVGVVLRDWNEHNRKK